MKLYSYFRSSAAYRVRIALNLKGLEYEVLPVNLLSGEQQREAYREVNPQGLLPALDTGADTVLSQSLAILEWLEETHPEPALLPTEPLARARVRGVAAHIACDIHPILNLAVLKYLKDPLGAGEDAVAAWYRHWIARGFRGVEIALAEGAGRCSFGDQPTLADCCLVPQVYNARRFEVPLQDYPRILEVAEHCEGLEAFAAAHPSRQPDAPV